MSMFGIQTAFNFCLSICINIHQSSSQTCHFYDHSFAGQLILVSIPCQNNNTRSNSKASQMFHVGLAAEKNPENKHYLKKINRGRIAGTSKGF